MGEAKRGIAANADRLMPAQHAGATVWMDARLPDRTGHRADLRVRVLPGGNVMFRATVVDAGQVIATWTRTLTATQADVVVAPLRRLSRARRRVEIAATSSDRWFALLHQAQELHDPQDRNSSLPGRSCFARCRRRIGGDQEVTAGLTDAADRL